MSDGPDAVERVRMALAEMGYPEAQVREAEDGPVEILAGLVDCVAEPLTLPPMSVAWKAKAVAGVLTSCWECSRRFRGDACTHDPYTEPWPPVVRP